MSKEWNPINGVILEGEALNAVKFNDNCYINAGPGAGKSELLIQKANYTFYSLIPNSYSKILAISYTNSAAKNLKARINDSFNFKMSKRFVSSTFDSFCRNIYDQFKNVLDEKFIASANFSIDYNAYLNFTNEFPNFVTKEILSEYGTAPDYDDYIKMPLIYREIDEITDVIHKELILKYIEYKIKNNSLTFEIIRQLALFIVKKNKQVVSCLRKTYPYVFVDEFQDTNNIQYSLLKEIFLNSDSKIICVGDCNQSIYSFAGANNQIVNLFINDFHAQQFFLKNNYRSQSSIVKLVNTIGKDLDNSLSPSISKVQEIENKEQELIILKKAATESEYVFEKIKILLKNKISPRDIAIFGKQKIDKLTIDIVNYCNKNGIKTRFEDPYIKILEDDFFKFCFSLIYITLYRDIDSYNFVIEIYESIYGYDFKYSKINNDLKLLKKFINSHKKLDEIFTYIIVYYNLKKLNIFNVLSMTKEFDNKIRILQGLIDFNYSNDKVLLETINNLYGRDTIPIITIHKSKGLQYNSVFLIGLENSQFKYYRKLTEEERLIYVAISRAKTNLYITCGNWRDRESKYFNKDLLDLIQQLKSNGLKVLIEK